MVGDKRRFLGDPREGLGAIGWTIQGIALVCVTITGIFFDVWLALLLVIPTVVFFRQAVDSARQGNY
jgi:hypothetical protein